VVPGGLAGDTANVGICGCIASRSCIIEVEPRPGAGGVLAWCDVGEWCATLTVGRWGILFFSLLLPLSLATGEAPEAEATGAAGAATRGEEGFRSRELEVRGGGLAVPSAGGDGLGARGLLGYST